jgi:pyridoxine 4-dehydrogenase
LEPATVKIGDIEVRRIGLGTLHLSGPGSWGEPRDSKGARLLLRRAIDLGVNLIDTADCYGPYATERLVADALYPYPDGVHIATKGGKLRTGQFTSWPVNGRPSYLRQACEGSLQRLRLDRIDLYQLHAVDPEVPIEESVGALADLQAEGKIRQIGLSNVTEDEVIRAQIVTPIASVQNRFNLSDRHAEGALELCDRHGLAFLPWQPLAYDGDTAARRLIAEVANSQHVTPAQIALAWLLARSTRIVVIPGTSSANHLKQNVAAARCKLTCEQVAALSDAFV